MADSPAHVLFACVHNAGRSQIAAALFNASANASRAVATSAGTQPADHPHPEVVKVLGKMGIDISDAKPRFLDSELAATATLLVTLGCGEQCPYIPGLEVVDWPIEDPKGQNGDKVEKIRDEVAQRVASLIEDRNW